MLLAITGIDGAGKTEQIQRISRWLVESGYQAQIVDKWDVFTPEENPQCRFLGRDPEELRLCFAEMEGIARPLFVFWMLSVTLPRDAAKRTDILLLDGYWMKYVATEMAYGCDAAWLKAAVAPFPMADLVLWLDLEPEEALRRKPRLTPYECGRDMSATPTAFLRHQRRVRSCMQELAVELKWRRISAMAPVDQVFSDVRDHLVASMEQRRPEPRLVPAPATPGNGLQRAEGGLLCQER
jgi:dTMP kinase